MLLETDPATKLYLMSLKQAYIMDVDESSVFIRENASQTGSTQSMEERI